MADILGEVLGSVKEIGVELLKFFKDNMATAAIFGKAGVYQNIFANALDGLQDKIMSKMGVNLGTEDFRPFGSVVYWDKIYKVIKNTNQELGIAGNLSRQIEDAYKATLPSAVAIGAEWKDIADEYKTFTEELGMNRAFTSKELYDLVEIRKAFGQGISKMAADMSIVGVGINRVVRNMKSLMVESNKTGANFKKILDTLSSNFEAMSKYSFVKGVRGMELMAKYAVETKLSVQSTLGFTEKILDGSIEGAIETAADLQLLGGSMAQFGDAFNLMFTARNKPEEFIEQVAEMAASTASFNRELGQIVIDPLGMSRLRELAKATGFDLGELVKAGENARRKMELRGLFDFNLQGKAGFEDMLTKVAGVAEFDKQINDWVVTLGSGVKKAVSLLSEGDIEMLYTVNIQNEEDVFKQLIETNKSISEKIQQLIDELKLNILGEQDYTRFNASIDTMITNLKTNLEGSWKPFVDYIKSMMGESFNNLMGFMDNLNSGDWNAVIGGVTNNLTDFAYEIGRVTLQLAKFGLMLTLNAAIWVGQKASVVADPILMMKAEIERLRSIGETAKADEYQRQLDEMIRQGAGGIKIPSFGDILPEFGGNGVPTTNNNPPINPNPQINNNPTTFSNPTIGIDQLNGMLGNNTFMGGMTGTNSNTNVTNLNIGDITTQNTGNNNQTTQNINLTDAQKKELIDSVMRKLKEWGY